MEDAVSNDKLLSQRCIRRERCRLHNQAVLNKDKLIIEHTQCVDKMILRHNKKVSELQEKWQKDRRRINGKVISRLIFFHLCYYPYYF